MAVQFRDYYEVLGVARGASDEEIKAAYRKLVRQHHPDLHPEKDKPAQTEKIKAINEAYSVLGDKDNRAKYDTFGENWKDGQRMDEEAAARYGARPGAGGDGARFRGFTGGEGPGPEAFSDFFSQFFGGEGGGRAEEWGGPAAAAPLDIEAEVALPIADAVRGGERAFTVQASSLCPECGGTGRRGRGFCRTCGGAGETLARREVRVRLPGGRYDGARVRLRGQGNEAGGKRGDLFVRVRLAPDARFRVRGADVETAARVMAWTAALGGEVSVDTPEGPLRVKVPAGTTAGKTLRLAGRGLGKPGGGRGDLLARVELDIPERLSDAQRRLFEQLREASDGGR